MFYESDSVKIRTELTQNHKQSALEVDFLPCGDDNDETNDME